MLRKIRLVLAIVFWILITWLLVDFTGTAHAYLGWMAKIQFIPAVLALNAVALLFLLALSLIFGRIYCSIICPLGVMQDAIAWFRKKKNKYSYPPARSTLRYGVLLLSTIILVANLGWLAGLLFPYSTYGRIVGTIVAPLYKMGNNVLAGIAEHYDSYAFYEVDVWLKSLPTLVIALVSWTVIAVLAWRGGRTWCNTICPVGTLLGLISKHSLYGPVIDTNKCNSCGLCARNCKSACINSKDHTIDMSRCVMCGNCMEKCNRNALTFGMRNKPACTTEKTEQKPQTTEKPVDEGRRAVLTSTALLAGSALVHAQEKTTDGGFAIIEDKQKPKRAHKIVPPGALSVRHLQTHCTACQLCIDSCPNDVLRPSSSLGTFMQPEVSFERGYCRPECNRCSQVCPTGAIQPITIEERTATQVGHAVWVEKNCIPAKEGKPCGNCARHCPTGAIQMVPASSEYRQGERGQWFNAENKRIDSRLVPMIPVVNVEKCIGCGACEYLCPSRPFSAIYVEGHDVHREI